MHTLKKLNDVITVHFPTSANALLLLESVTGVCENDYCGPYTKSTSNRFCIVSSGMDIAVELSHHASQVYVVSRRGIKVFVYLFIVFIYCAWHTLQSRFFYKADFPGSCLAEASSGDHWITVSRASPACFLTLSETLLYV